MGTAVGETMDGSHQVDKHATARGATSLVADWLCLALVNTVDLRLSRRDESLTSYADLAAWSQRMSILTADEAQVLLGEAGRRPADATRVLERALMLREALYDLFAAVARGVPPPPVAVDTLNVALADAAAQARFVPTVDSLTWAWLDRKDSLDTMLWPVARSAVDLLTAAERRRLRECPGSPGKACGWLFVDTSKNRSRRWCVTGLCGNRARAHRHYHRRQGARQPTHDT